MKMRWIRESSFHFTFNLYLAWSDSMIHILFGCIYVLLVKLLSNFDVWQCSCWKVLRLMGRVFYAVKWNKNLLTSFNLWVLEALHNTSHIIIALYLRFLTHAYFSPGISMCLAAFSCQWHDHWPVMLFLMCLVPCSYPIVLMLCRITLP